VILENGHVHFCERRIEVAEKDEETLSAFSKIDTWSFENRHVEFRKSTFAKRLVTTPTVKRAVANANSFLLRTNHTASRDVTHTFPHPRP
jgi:hypothetical protein